MGSTARAIAAEIGDRDADDRATVDIGRQLHVVRRSIAAVGHLHDARIGIGRRHPRLRGPFALLPLLGRLEGRQLRERFLDAGHAVRGGALLGRIRARVDRRVGLFLDALDLFPGLAQTLRQRLAAPERPGPGTAAHARPILGHPRHRDNPALQQRGNRLRQQIVERGLMRDAEITQRVVIHRDPAAQPAIGVMAVAEPIHFARAADAVHGRVEPERDQDLGINRRAAGAAFPRADGRIERRQIQALDEAPDQARRVARRQQRLKVAGLQLDLITIRRLVPRRRVIAPVAGRPRITVGKQGVAHALAG